MALKYHEKKRKVRFNLSSEPKEKLQNSIIIPTNKCKDNKIISYDNRSNVNIPKNQITSYEKIIQRTYKPINIRILPSTSVTLLKSYKNLTDTTNEYYNRNQISPLSLNENNQKYSNTIKTTTFTIPFTMALSKPISNIHTKQQKQQIKHLVILNNTTTKLNNNNIKMVDNLKICDYFSRFRIFEEILKKKRKSLRLSEKADRKVIYLKPLRTSVPQTNEIGGIENYLHSNENHSRTLADLIQRLKRMRLRETELKINNNILMTKRKDPIESAVFFRSFNTSDVVKRFGCFKMSLERQQPIPTLLRAARDADSYLLKIIFKKIIIDGITPEVLNQTDRSGRTALSYICSTDLIQYLELLLQLKGIDVNIGDNEGNTPLHYAAQSGQSEIVNILLTRCRSIQIDAKNCWGFTPMMKAALQGKTRCAKLLLFAGASPSTTDTGRCLNAAEWARFTGRDSCAEMIEQCTKARQLKSKIRPCSPININTNVKRQNSILSKINKMFPFKGSIKEKKSSQNNSVNLKSNIVFNSKSVPFMTTEQLHDLTMNNSPVPKLIITQQQNDVEFMKKFEKKQSQQKYVPKRRVRNEI